jgi:hypothetical protein
MPTPLFQSKSMILSEVDKHNTVCSLKKSDFCVKSHTTLKKLPYLLFLYLFCTCIPKKQSLNLLMS